MINCLDTDFTFERVS